jgi:hypothetical protein
MKYQKIAIWRAFLPKMLFFLTPPAHTHHVYPAGPPFPSPSLPTTPHHGRKKFVAASSRRSAPAAGVLLLPSLPRLRAPPPSPPSPEHERGGPAGRPPSPTGSRERASLRCSSPPNPIHAARLPLSV